MPRKTKGFIVLSQISKNRRGESFARFRYNFMEKTVHWAIARAKLERRKSLRSAKERSRTIWNAVALFFLFQTCNGTRSTWLGVRCPSAQNVEALTSGWNKVGSKEQRWECQGYSSTCTYAKTAVTLNCTSRRNRTSTLDTRRASRKRVAKAYSIPRFLEW